MAIDAFSSYSRPIGHDGDVTIETEEPSRCAVLIGEEDFDGATIKANETDEIARVTVRRHVTE